MYKTKLSKQTIVLPKGVVVPDCSYLSLESLYHAPGQAAAIRFFDPEAPKDLESMRIILKAKPVKRWMDEVEYLSKADYKEWAGTPSKTSFLFAVLDARTSDFKDLNRVRGFVYLYSEREEKYRVKRMEKAGFIAPKKGESYYLEASFALRPIDPKVHTGSGLMSSALRQSCLQAHLLLNSPKKPDIQIFAFVDQDNLPAKRTLESAGFVLQGHMKYDRDSEDASSLYLLNWRKLHKKIRQQLLNSASETAHKGV
jgi:RimJ/RimL family protein N-acetyltransferase